MRRVLIPASLILLASFILGTTVFREQVAQAAQLLNVEVMNDAAHPVPVHEQASQQPVQVRAFGSFPNGDRFSSEETLYTVPDGKTLVVEAFSTGSNMEATDVFTEARLDVELGAVNSGVTWYLQPTDEGVSGTGSRIFRGSALVRGYAGPGTTVVASAVRDGASLSGTSVSFAISGYLVDTP